MTNEERMYQAYIEAIYFTETGDGDQPPNTAELTPLSKAQAYIDCRNFLWGATEALQVPERQIDWSQAGHDLWLTRNGHGTGFWDREDNTYGSGPNGEPLKTIFTAMAKAMGQHDITFQE